MLASGWDRLRELTWGDVQFLVLIGFAAFGLIGAYIGAWTLGLSILRELVR